MAEICQVHLMARFQRATLPSLEEVEDLGMRAASGNNEAFDELGQLAEKLGRRANQRMRELEKAGKTGDAYRRIQESLGGKTRFSQSRTGNVEDIVDRIHQSMSALARKESTLGGIREVDSQTVQSLYDRFGIDKEVTRADVDKFNRFVESDLWNDFKKVRGGSGGVLEQFTQRLADETQDVDDLIQAFEDWGAAEEDQKPDVFSAVGDWFEW